MSLVELLVPFRCPVTIVRRNPQPVTGVRSVVGSEELDGALAGSRVLFVALALTPQTVGIVDRRRMALLGSDGGLVNVARGRHVITADLVAALEAGEIGFAGLDVTDPEPLPQSHPLWAHPSCLITPHTANSAEMAVSFLAAQISRNVANFAEGRPLEGLVDLAAGY